MEVTPELVLAMWAAGMAFGAGMVSWWAIVGPGYGWLTSGAVLVVGGAAALAAGSPLGFVAAALALAAGIVARRGRPAAVLFGSAGLLFLALATSEGIAVAVTGSVLLGAMTSEMLLGHWFLVAPQLPRWALERLALAAGAGLAADVAVLALLGAFRSDDGVMIAAMAALSLMTALLVIAVRFSLREPGYSGVMAATGLSYLGMLTTFGVVVVGRLLVAGL